MDELALSPIIQSAEVDAPLLESVGDMARREALRKVLADHAQPDPALLGKLPRSTRKDNPKRKCDECGGYHGLPAVHLDYLGHADLTEVLIKVDPLWSWRPFVIDENTGGPKVTVRNGTATMWGYLTVLGVERPAVGTAPADKDDRDKELVSDFLRNAGMRFGIAVRLWSKADHQDIADEPEPTTHDVKWAKFAVREALDDDADAARKFWDDEKPGDGPFTDSQVEALKARAEAWSHEEAAK